MNIIDKFNNKNRALINALHNHKIMEDAFNKSLFENELWDDLTVLRKITKSCDDNEKGKYIKKFFNTLMKTHNKNRPSLILAMLFSATGVGLYSVIFSVKPHIIIILIMISIITLIIYFATIRFYDKSVMKKYGKIVDLLLLCDQYRMDNNYLRKVIRSVYTLHAREYLRIESALSTNLTEDDMLELRKSLLELGKLCNESADNVIVDNYGCN